MPSDCPSGSRFASRGTPFFAAIENRGVQKGLTLTITAHPKGDRSLRTSSHLPRISLERRSAQQGITDAGSAGLKVSGNSMLNGRVRSHRDHEVIPTGRSDQREEWR